MLAIAGISQLMAKMISFLHIATPVYYCTIVRISTLHNTETGSLLTQSGVAKICSAFKYSIEIPVLRIRSRHRGGIGRAVRICHVELTGQLTVNMYDIK